MSKLDADSSGAASLDEFKSVGQNLPAGNVDASDSAIESAFSTLDGDGDGSLTQSEVQSGLSKFSSDSASALLGAQESAPPRPPQGGPGEGGFETADADDSGTVSLDEFVAAGPDEAGETKAEEMFSTIDSDGDGEISESEDEAFQSAQAESAPPAPPPGPPSAGEGESASSEEEDDEDETTAASLESMLSELMQTNGAYAQTSATSYLDQALSSLFQASA
ncbi:Ca2+-binding EF-hand superfamily protein [Methylopila capsulata]|nr:EF-hand domain-containing protein [Methylopila capsulata]MBM7850558.1 Ca2+-binding EF-hand superfamily protein [Methylopila capsulata]